MPACLPVRLTFPTLSALSIPLCPPFLCLPAFSLPLQQMMDEGAAVAVVSTVVGALEAEDWPLAGEAAWALELMAGFSRRLTSKIG
jgi:hypothetical protein